MKAKTIPEILASVIDPHTPWKQPRPYWKFPPYPYKVTSSAWKSLIARASLGDAEAEWIVGGYYDDGCKTPSEKILVRRSPRKAIEWFRRSAAHGNTSAQVTLGVLLSSAKASKEERREAYVWTKKAARTGSNIAIKNLAVMYREDKDFRRAALGFRKVTARKDGEAQVQLGIHSYWGIGIRINHAAAVKLWRDATRGKNISEHGRDDAFFYLGIAYLEGAGIRQSIPTARKLLERANKDNDHPAASRLLKKIKKISTN